MAHIMRKLAVAAAAALSLSAAQADVLDFEDLSGAGLFPGTSNAPGLQVSAAYHGLFQFRYWNGSRSDPNDPYSACANCEGSWYFSDGAIPSTDPVWASGTNTSISTDYYSFPVSGSATNVSYAITTVMPIVWQGMDLIATSGTTTVTVSFFLNGNLVGTSGVLTLTENSSQQSIPLSWNTNTFFNASNSFDPQPGGVYADTVFVGGLQGFYAVDNITYLPIPEPGTYALMAAGLLAVGTLARRRKAQ